METKLTRTNDSDFIYGPVTQDFWDFNAPINVNPAGGGGGACAQKAGIWLFSIKNYQIAQGGRITSIKSAKNSPTLGQRI